MSESIQEDKQNVYPPEEEKSAPQSLNNSEIELNAHKIGPVKDDDTRDQYLALSDLVGQDS